MEKRQRFTPEFKREAVRLLQKSGKPAAVVAREPKLWLAANEERDIQVVQQLARPRSGGDDEPILMTVEQAAALLTVPVSWLKQRVSAQTVACTRLGRHIRFTRQQVATIVAANEQPVALTPLTGLTSRSRRPA